MSKARRASGPRPAFPRGLVGLAALIACAAFPGIAGAALGEAEASVVRDTAQLSGSVKIMAHDSYRLHEIQAASGTRVREFVAPDGRIFAVAWNGPAIPNLRETLGKYFDDYAAAAKSTRAGHNRLVITQGDLVVESSGHMRAFSGVAYLRSAIPAGVDAGALH